MRKELLGLLILVGFVVLGAGALELFARHPWVNLVAFVPMVAGMWAIKRFVGRKRE